ncbi:MAG: hypothetical protein KDI74_11030 [Gammaproteobacteria bacterium]|nr:hypothetical protein [Gammaproteobacteria bacterium]HXK55504.1 hypothetical protein [Gammaproteobacteria bacterium]
MEPVKTNLLDRKGFKVLFDLHTQSVRSSVIELFEDIHKQRKRLGFELDRDLLAKEVKEVIYASRDRLDIFRVEGIPDIKQFLESNLSSETLDRLIREAIDIVLSSGETGEQSKRAIEYIKRTQIGLLKEINTKIIDKI